MRAWMHTHRGTWLRASKPAGWKANLDMATILALAVLAGAFIALGANFATIVLTDTGVGYGLSRLAGGLVFSLGLILVGGAELLRATF